MFCPQPCLIWTRRVSGQFTTRHRGTSRRMCSCLHPDRPVWKSCTVKLKSTSKHRSEVRNRHPSISRPLQDKLIRIVIADRALRSLTLLCKLGVHLTRCRVRQLGSKFPSRERGCRSMHVYTTDHGIKYTACGVAGSVVTSQLQGLPTRKNMLVGLTTGIPHCVCIPAKFHCSLYLNRSVPDECN